MEKFGHLEKCYLPYLSKNPPLLMFYKWEKNLPISDNISPLTNELFRWLLLYPDARFRVQWHHLFPNTEDKKKKPWSIPKQLSPIEAKAKLRNLRKKDPETLYRLARVHSDRYIIYGGAMYLFILDQLAPWISQTVSLFRRYYADKMPKEQEMSKYVEVALLGALLDNHPWLRLNLWIKAFATRSELDPFYYWGSFWQVDICERFKENLYKAIGCPTANLGKLDDNQFATEFEKEWQRVVSFQDLRGGFHIMPLFTHTDMVRYANLSQRNQDIVYQMVDYVVLKICPKLFQTIDHIEPSRFRKWQELLLGLMQPLVDEVIKQQKRVKDEGREEKLRRGLTPKEKREVRENVESRILSLATIEYYYLYGKNGKKVIPRDIRILMKEMELNSKKISAVTKKEGFNQKMLSSLLQKDKDLTRRFRKRSASWVEEDGSLMNYHLPYLPWGHFLGSRSDEEIKKIKKRGAYPRRALLKRTENLLREYRKAEEEKNWGKAKELIHRLREVQRERETGQSVLRVREKSRWVWPSYFIYQKIRKHYLLDEHAESLPQKVSHLPDGESSWEDALDDELGQKALTAGAVSPDEFTEYARLEALNQKQFLDKNVVTEDDSGHKREYVRIGELAAEVKRSPKTLIRMEERGEIEFEWRRVKGGEIQAEGKSVGKRGRWMRLFPVEKIEELKYYFKNDKDIAKDAGVRADYLPKLKKKLGLDELPRCQQKKKLIEYFEQRRKNRK